jgi:hypothetical protein
MKWLLLLLFLFVAAAAQSQTETDTIYRITLHNQNVSSTRKWADDTARYHYNQTRYYITTILPYVEEATALFNDLSNHLRDPALKGKARRAYIRGKETLVHTRFEEKIRSLNETQGVLLIKLCARQTGLNLYEQISDFKGTLPAMKWQLWARLHGFNLNRKYHPEEEPDLERIMTNLGYPLPAFYAGGDAR